MRTSQSERFTWPRIHCCSFDNILGFNPSLNSGNAIIVADVHVLHGTFQVFSCKANIIRCTSFRVHPLCKSQSRICSKMCTDNHIISFQIQFKIFIERFMNSLQWHQCFGSVSRFLCRRSGCCYWTMSLCMPMNMRLWFYVATVFIDDSFRIFFIIVLITQKSKLLQHYL